MPLAFLATYAVHFRWISMTSLKRLHLFRIYLSIILSRFSEIPIKITMKSLMESFVDSMWKLVNFFAYPIFDLQFFPSKIQNFIQNYLKIFSYKRLDSILSDFNGYSKKDRNFFIIVSLRSTKSISTCTSCWNCDKYLPSSN